MAEQLDIESLFKLNVDELKLELGKRSLSKSGSKSELQERLLQHVTTHDGSAIIQNFEVESIDSIDEETKEELADILKKPDEPNDKKLSNDSDSVDRFIDSIPNSNGEDITGNGNHNADDVVDVSVDRSDDAIVDKIDEDELISAHNSDDKLCQKTEKTNSSSDDANKKQKITYRKPTALISPPEEKRNNRSKRFGASSESEKKKARLDRFSISSKGTEINEEKIKKRKERFGAVSSVLVKSEDIDRIKKRKERFADETIKKRQERFGVIQKVTVDTISAGTELRKQQRLLKFGAD